MASVSSAGFSGHGAPSLLQFLRLMGQLKRVPRTGWVYRNVQRPESVSDHMYRMAIMAMVIKDDRLNKDRCVRLALVHDMAECIVGDIAPADNIPKEEKHRREEEAMKQITQLLPEDLRKELYELWEKCVGERSKMVDGYISGLQLPVKHREREDATLSDKFWLLTEQKIPSGGAARVASATLVASAVVCWHLGAAALGAE
uniref:5'-deoxynucleotidase HDDC2 isoform X4 n=1 Tax=Callithrix jacchus TaxID=9483 RepID=UPI0023DD2CBA|nr:5'-deoxynucleotidase HDDC2 isoform X4 [Callithrix jacchus]